MEQIIPSISDKDKSIQLTDDFGYVWYKADDKDISYNVSKLLNFDFFLPQGYKIKKIDYINPKNINNNVFILPNKPRSVYVANGRYHNLNKNRNTIILSRLNLSNNKITDTLDDDIVIYSNEILAIYLEYINDKDKDRNFDAINTAAIYDEMPACNGERDDKNNYNRINNFVSSTNKDIKKITYDIPEGWQYVDEFKYGNTVIGDKIFFNGKLYEIIMKYNYDHNDIIFKASEIDKYTGECVHGDIIDIYKNNTKNIYKVKIDSVYDTKYKWAQKVVIDKKYKDYEKNSVKHLNELNIGDFFTTSYSNDIFQLKYKKENIIAFAKDAKNIIAVATNTKTKKDELFYNDEVCAVLDKKTFLYSRWVKVSEFYITGNELNIGDYFVEKGYGDKVYQVVSKDIKDNKFCIIAKLLYTKKPYYKKKRFNMMDMLFLYKSTKNIKKFYIGDKVVKVHYQY